MDISNALLLCVRANILIQTHLRLARRKSSRVTELSSCFFVYCSIVN